MHFSTFNKIDDLDLSSFNFDQPLEKTDILEFIKEKEFFSRDAVKNFYHLFKNVPVLKFEDSAKKLCVEDDVFNKIQGLVCWSEENVWNCHIAAPYYAVCNNNYDCVFGFARQKNEGSNITNTFLHSFNSIGNDFVDATIQSRDNQQKWWIEKKSIVKPSFLFENFVSYTGIVIPKNILNDILFSRIQENITGNLWGYIKNKVLCSEEKTNKFIEVLNTNGTGWVYEK